MKDTSFRRIPGFAIVVSGLILFLGFLQQADFQSHALYFVVLKTLYKTIQAFLFEFDSNEITSVLMLVGVYLAPLSLVSAVIISFLISGKRCIQRTAIFLGVRNHVILCGNGHECLKIIINHITSTSNLDVVFIQPDEKLVPEDILHSAKIHCLEENGKRSKTWRYAGIKRAQGAVVFPENTAEATEYLQAISAAAGDKKVEVHFAISNIHELNVLSDNKEIISVKTDNLDSKPFHTESLASTAIVEQFAPHTRVSIDSISKTGLHLLFVGFNSLCERVLFEAVQLYHYPGDIKALYTIVVQDRREIETFLGKYPGISDIITIQIIEKPSLLPDITCDEFLFQRPPSAVYFFPSDGWAVPESGRTWRRHFYLQWGLTGNQIPLLFFLSGKTDLPETFSSFTAIYSHLNLELYDTTDFVNLNYLIRERNLTDSLAREIHLRYMSRYSMPCWEDLCEREKDFNRRSARHHLIKLACFNLALVDRNSAGEESDFPRVSEHSVFELAKMEHKRWIAEKILDGYISCPGEISDEEYKKIKNTLRLQKDIRPFDQLSDEDIRKDIETFSEWKELMNKMLTEKKLVVLKQDK